MNTLQQNITAPSVTIAARKEFNVVFYVVTFTTHTDSRSYPCKTQEAAIELAGRFLHRYSNRDTNPLINLHMHNLNAAARFAPNDFSGPECANNPLSA